MYNYGLTGYALTPKTVDDALFACDWGCLFDGAVHTGGNTYESMTAQTAFNAQSIMAAAVSFASVFAGAVAHASLGAVDIPMAIGYTESYARQAALGLNIPVATSCYATFERSMDGGCNIYPAPTVAVAFSKSNRLGANIAYSQPVMTMLVEAYVTQTAYTTKTCTFHGALLPGQTLVIDSETYNVLLDGANAIALHDGDWFELGRHSEVLTLDASSGTPNVDVRVLYQERWL